MPNLQSNSTGPDYIGLVKFLIEPFLEDPDALSIDLEYYRQKERVWIRLAFDETDKGKVFGRGGRNLQAIRSVLETTANGTGRSLYLEVYEGEQRRGGRRPGNYTNGFERRPNNRRPRSAPRRPIEHT
ncbi:KH domain-containing protein [Pannus brasiliensis CCIBt3594]|uniref:KH domain-containing protein n=1 Tax=Pannus brasiliensis CCIBt3594 TaxID=1427578 RepID=A0AAW9QQS8_9CHRO